ncbi:hypothetical protein MBLNU13_g05263t2 [Cladosporium sp. NU13]
MSKSGEEPDNVASDHTIEEQSRAAAAMVAGSGDWIHDDLVPESVLVFNQASDTEHRPQYPRNSKSRSLEGSNQSTEGQYEEPSITEGSWSPKDANFNTNQYTWRWQGQDSTTRQYPQQPAHARGKVNLAIRTQDLPAQSRSTSPVPTPLDGMYTSASRWQPQDSLPKSATYEEHAPYNFTDVPDIDHTEAPYPYLWPHVEALDATGSTSTTLEDIGPSSQPDDDAHVPNAEHPKPKESQVEGSSSPLTSSESLICPVCKLQLLTTASFRSLGDLSPQAFRNATWLPVPASSLAGDIMDTSHTSQSLPVRDASATSAEYCNSSETGSSPFEQSKTAKDAVVVDTACSSASLPGHVGALAAADNSSFDIFGEHHQQLSRRYAGTTLSRDFDDDQSSCAESVFSQESTASTATSLSGSFGTTGFLEMVNRTASALFSGDVASSINSAAVEDPDIGPERYRRNIRRMIKTFGKSLRAEADTMTEHRIAAAMQTRKISTHVAQEIMTRAKVPRPSSCRPAECSEWMNEEQHSDTSTESADEDEVVLTQEPEDEAKIRIFVLDSAACLQFKRTLLDFVHKPYEKRILTALDSSLNQSLTKADRFKGYVEDFMGETWNWSPFTARRYPLQADCCRLSWKSPNGESRSIDLPKDVEGAVRDAFDTAPKFLNQVDPTSAIRKLAAGATSNSAPAIPLPSYQPGAGKASSLQAGPQIPSQSLGAPIPSVPCGLQLYAQATQVQQNSHHIYLCVEAGSREFVGLSCAGIRTDIQFFDRIKSEYNAARGWFRLWFSTWRYDHCEFMQFQKIGIRLGARLQIAFPAPTDQLYDYMPKPLKEMELPPHGPISPDEFRQHYYYQVCPSLLSWERWHGRRTGLSLAETKAFDAAPKRVVELDMQNGRREIFYGLYAKEARSALRVAIHMSICCFPGVIFFFLWLYQWGHGADLQGAAVPVQLSLTLVAGYLGVLYWTR